VKSPEAIVFDLDGTLWDTTEACAVAWNRVLARLEIPYRPIVGDDVRAVTGKPHGECIQVTFSDLTQEQIHQITSETEMEDNLAISQLGGDLYPGVEEGLRRLAKRFRIFIVSNCQSGYIETFLSFSGLSDVFEDFECWGNTGRTKGENLASLLKRNGVISAVMVGDTDGDEAAARFCGIPFAFVSYGFGRGVAPDFEFGNFGELVENFSIEQD
jgi:phosphoglycolate phosphatase